MSIVVAVWATFTHKSASTRGCFWGHTINICSSVFGGWRKTAMRRMREFVELSLSILKAVLFDVGLTLDSYFLHATENLQHALEMVFQANFELRQFAQLTSHDLKTPLGTVANLCEEVLDEFGEKIPTAARELITAARNRAYRMSQTIDELLASALTSHSDDQNEAFSSELVINQAADPIKPLLDERQIELSISGPLPWVSGDPIKIREAFYNLFNNAAKFIDKRPGRIAVSARLEDGDCIFCVADNGPGIPPEELQRIFVPFRRLPKHRNEPGSGLGLYFTKSLIERQGGKIWVESQVGQGSRFYVRLKTRQASRAGAPIVCGIFAPPAPSPRLSPDPVKAKQSVVLRDW